MLPLGMVRSERVEKTEVEGLGKERERKRVSKSERHRKIQRGSGSSHQQDKVLLLYEDYLRAHKICWAVHEANAIDGKAEIERVRMANNMSRRPTDLYNHIGKVSGFWIINEFDSKAGIDGLSTINEKPLKTTGLHNRISKAMGELCIEVESDRFLQVKLCDGTVRDMFILYPAQALSCKCKGCKDVLSIVV